eukprot:4722122-Pleurochrysis_carterae.AAC.1
MCLPGAAGECGEQEREGAARAPRQRRPALQARLRAGPTRGAALQSASGRRHRDGTRLSL